MSRPSPPPSHRPLPGRPVLVGEVLFDRFPDGSQALGGAPFNVAWHLQALGLEPLLVTRVGDDDLGRRIRDAMEGWGLDASGVQTDADHATGTVDVELEDGSPTFDIIDDRAWDHLDRDEARTALEGVDVALVYHGTLIAREETSRSTLFDLRLETAAPAFLDVNLRPPWWTEQVVRQALFGARWVKLNADELVQLGVEGSPDEVDPVAAAEALRRRHALESVIVTMGSDGAAIVTEGGRVRGTPPPMTDARDTVGAGDAFASVCITGLVHGWTAEVTLSRALTLSAAICQVRGAVSSDPELYRDLRRRWDIPAAPGVAVGRSGGSA